MCVEVAADSTCGTVRRLIQQLAYEFWYALRRKNAGAEKSRTAIKISTLAKTRIEFHQVQKLLTITNAAHQKHTDTASCDTTSKSLKRKRSGPPAVDPRFPDLTPIPGRARKSEHAGTSPKIHGT